MTSSPLWAPRPEAMDCANLSSFCAHLSQKHGISFSSYKELHTWSVRHMEAFWDALWDFCQVIGDKGSLPFQEASHMKDTRFFPQGFLNYAENLLRHQSEDTAIVFWGEDTVRRSLSFKQLYDEVSTIAQYLRGCGVKPGDRVVGFTPNTPEAVIAMLATASLGGVWASCSPDFGVQGVLDRFSQISPKVFVCADYYLYKGTKHPCGDKISAILSGLPSVQTTLVYSYAGPDQEPLLNISGPGVLSWNEARAQNSPSTIDFQKTAFNDPLFIMFSSGTTGVPKCILHGHGGTLLQHLKEHQLHCNLSLGDRLFYFTTCGWMMWNWQVSGLATGATLLLYDGSPFHPTPEILFDYAQNEKMTLFGTAAKFIDALCKEEVDPKKTHNLSCLRTITSTGSPLSPEGFEYVYSHIKSDVNLASISGGTDIISCFVLGIPTLPVYAGQIQGAGLGMDVQIFDERGSPTRGEKGELVCVTAFPSMPLGFWQDPDGEKYHQAYFDKFPGVWCHGDFAALTAQEGFIIYGRSDAVLNPGGVRIGTAEIYRQVERMEDVLESIAVGQSFEGDVRVLLFVKLREGLLLNDELASSIKRMIRANTTPRHVPALIFQVPEIPRTKNGKLVELAVKNIIEGKEVPNKEALANPEALEHFKGLVSPSEQ